MTNTQRITIFSLGLCLAFFTYSVSEILAPFILAFVISYLLNPLVSSLNEKFKINNALSTLLVLSMFFLILTSFFMLLGPLVYNQVVALIGKINSYSGTFEKKYLSKIIDWLKQISPNTSEQLKDSLSNMSKQILVLTGKILGNIVKSGIIAVNALSLIFITPVVSFYLLRDWKYFRKNFYSLIPNVWKNDAEELLSKMHLVIMGFFRGQILVCSVLAVYYVISFSLIGLESWLALGILSGILIFIPFLGAFISTILCFIIALLQFGIGYKILLLTCILLVGQMLEGMIITPKLVGDNVGLHPIWIIFSLLAAGTLFGFLGVVVAVPISALIGVIVRFYLNKYKN